VFQRTDLSRAVTRAGAATPFLALACPARTRTCADLLPLGDDIRLDWVASRAVHFPHLLNRRLPLTAVVGAWPVPWDGAAFSVWPSELQ